MAKEKNKKRWLLVMRIALVVVILALVGAVAGLAIKLDRQTLTTRIGAEAYSVGTINDDTGKVEEGDTAIYTRKAFTVSGLTCELEKNAEITYKLFFYDEEGGFISATQNLSVDYDGTGIPAKADTVRIMITPTKDSDGKVSVTEVFGYAGLLTVIVNR